MPPPISPRRAGPGRPGRRGRPGVFVLLVALLACLLPITPGRVAAHDLKVTHATLAFTQGQYQLSVVVDPESLLARLEIYADREPTIDPPVDEVRARIEALAEVAAARVRVEFDGVAVPVAFSYTPVAPQALAAAASAGGRDTASGTAASKLPPALVQFTGPVPAGARVGRVTYGLVLGSYALTLVNADGASSPPIWAVGGQPTPELDLRAGLVAPPWWVTLGEYAALGFTHILPKGLDHILFVVGLFLLGTRWKPLLLQVTLFTIAHSVTLGLSMLGLVSLSPAIVEPLIALSIAYVAVENLFTTELSPWRGALVFLFGLLHGLGFAGVLGELGMPAGQFTVALIAFNVGVELGQLAVIGLAMLAVGWWRATRLEVYRRWVVVPVSLAIAAVGLYWTVTRAAGAG
jgi:hypothetical protein